MFNFHACLKLDCYFSSPNELANSANKSIDRYVVVATQGAGDVAALKSALSGSAAYMAFVGSKKKFASYVKKLLAAGISKECLDKVYRACHEAQMEVKTEEREKHRSKK